MYMAHEEASFAVDAVHAAHINAIMRVVINISAKLQ
jgi:hypothetical protein